MRHGNIDKAGTATGFTKTEVGLSEVDNKSEATIKTDLDPYYENKTGYIAGTVAVASANTERSITGNTAYTKKKEITMGHAGIVTVSFDLKWATAGTAYARIYINDVAVGTERTSTSGTYTTYTENFTVVVGDKVQLYIKGNYSTCTSYVRNFQILVTVVPVGDTVDLN